MDRRLAAWCSGLWTGFGVGATAWVVQHDKPITAVTIFVLFAVMFGYNAWSQETTR